MGLPAYDDAVFINCPLDDEYRPVFQVIIFAIFDCGYTARSALEFIDTGEVRIDKIIRIIGQCRYGIHDISRTELDAASGLPRFNMPLELGLFLGAGRFGNKLQRTKVCLVLDRERFRYQRFISDIAGQDVLAHDNDPQNAVRLVRDWLRVASGRSNIPGGAEIFRRYRAFREDLPLLCKEARIDEHEIIFNEYAAFVSAWLQKATGQNGEDL